MESIIDVLILGFLLSLFLELPWVTRLGPLKRAGKWGLKRDRPLLFWKLSLAVFLVFIVLFFLFVFGFHVASEWTGSDSFTWDLIVFSDNFFSIDTLVFAASAFLMLFCNYYLLAGNYGYANRFLFSSSFFYFLIIVDGLGSFWGGGLFQFYGVDHVVVLPLFTFFLVLAQLYLFWRYGRIFLQALFLNEKR